MAPVPARWHASEDARGARLCRLEAVPTPARTPSLHLRVPDSRHTLFYGLLGQWLFVVVVLRYPLFANSSLGTHTEALMHLICLCLANLRPSAHEHHGRCPPSRGSPFSVDRAAGFSLAG
jgi:hypothetical protein